MVKLGVINVFITNPRSAMSFAWRTTNLLPQTSCCCPLTIPTDFATSKLQNSMGEKGFERPFFAFSTHTSTLYISTYIWNENCSWISLTISPSLWLINMALQRKLNPFLLLFSETNLKSRQCLEGTNQLGQNEHALSHFNGHIVCEPPNNNLSRFASIAIKMPYLGDSIQLLHQYAKL